MRFSRIMRSCFVIGLFFLSLLTAGCSMPFFHSDETQSAENTEGIRSEAVANDKVESRQLGVGEKTETKKAASTQVETVSKPVEATATASTVAVSNRANKTLKEKTVNEKGLVEGQSVNQTQVATKVKAVDKKLVPVKTVQLDEPVEPTGDGNVLRVVGRATVTTADGEIRQIAKGSAVNSSDMISTSSRSYVRMKMKDDSYVMIRPDSRLSIDDFKYDKSKPKEDKGFYSLLKGGFRSVTGLMKDKKKYRYRTAVATIGIRGTEFSVRVCNFDCYDVDPLPENGFYLEVHDKKVIISTKAGDYPFTKGQFAYVADSNSPAVLVTDIPDIFDQAPIPSPTQDCDQ